MIRRDFFLIGAAAAASLVLKADDKGSRLLVHVRYTGSGTVDESHKVYVALWDTPDFTRGGSSMMPIAVKGITSKSATASFDDVQQNPVYVSLAYDPSGKWDAHSEPPAGSSLSLYSKEPGKPAPISLEPGKTTEISVALHDSFKSTGPQKR